MRQKSGPVKESAEKVVKDIRRATRRRQRKGDRSAAIIGQSMDFARSSAAMPIFVGTFVCQSDACRQCGG